MIYYVEDDANIRDLAVYTLSQAGFETKGFPDAEPFFAACEQQLPDVVLLDIMLPGIDGLEILRRLRSHEATQHLPIMMLTAKTSTQDKVEGLDCGADDYMTKPFEAPELLARVRALTRRKGEMVIDTMEFGDLSLNLETHDLSCGDASAHLSKREFDVMRMLMSGTGRIVSKQDLLTRVWGADADASENSVEAYVSFLRKKIKHVKSKVEITTLRMLGYRLEVVDQAAEAR